MQEALRLQMLWLRVPQRRPPLGVGPGAGPGAKEDLLDSPLCRLVQAEEHRSLEEASMLLDSAEGAGRADRLRSRVLTEGQDARRQLKAINEERVQLQVRARLPCPVLPCPALPCPALPCPALPCPLSPATSDDPRGNRGPRPLASIHPPAGWPPGLLSPIAPPRPGPRLRVLGLVWPARRVRG